MANVTVSVAIKLRWWFRPALFLARIACVPLARLSMLDERRINAIAGWLARNGVTTKVV